MPLTNFQEALKQLGSNDIERGKVIGVSERTVRLWREKEPRIIQILGSTSVLAQALAKDAGLYNAPTNSAQTPS